MLDVKILKKIYEERPFQVRNADEFDLLNVIQLFVDPTDGLHNPFSFENSIIRGSMGSGKTMYLRANHAYFLFSIPTNLFYNEPIILPVYIRLSDFQNLSDANEIYNAVLLQIVREIGDAYKNFLDTQKLVALHAGISMLYDNTAYSSAGMKAYVERLHILSADEYITKTQEAINGRAGVDANFCALSAEYSNSVEIELRKKLNPTIQDISDAYRTLLEPFDGKLLILFDEVSSLHKSFFQPKDGLSMFETLMNQLRTLNFVRTKIAIYPQDYSDILPETRYGDAIYLQENIKDDHGYQNYLNRTISLIEQYTDELTKTTCKAEDLFEIDNGKMNVLEQLINASNGNTRRLVHLLDLSLNVAFRDHNGTNRVTLTHVMEALKEHSRSLEQQYPQPDIEFLRTIAATCRARSTFMFRFPNKSINLQRFTQKSSEYNIITLIQPGSGRKGAVYAIDYAYSVYTEVPTHYLKNSERIDKDRSRISGQWITKITTINDNIIENAQIAGKIEGNIVWLSSDSKETTGFIKSDDGGEYFLLFENIIENDRKRAIRTGTRVRFLPVSMDNMKIAYYIEILS